VKDERRAARRNRRRRARAASQRSRGRLRSCAKRIASSSPRRAR
jgi:hypothetical protein